MQNYNKRKYNMYCLYLYFLYCYLYIKTSCT